MEIPKASKIIFSLMFLIPIFGGIYYVKSQAGWPGSIDEVGIYLLGSQKVPTYVWEQREVLIKQKKDQERESILLWMSSSFIIVLAAGFIVKKYEFKNNPEQILARLKARGVIKEEEYQQKLNSILEVEESKSLSKAIRSERKDLQKLKSKGLISNIDYEEKLHDLSNKFSGSKEESFENQEISIGRKSTKSDFEKLLLFLLPLWYVLFNLFLLISASNKDHSYLDPRSEFLFPWDFADEIKYGYNEYDLSEFIVYAVIPVFLFWGIKYVFRDKTPLEGTIFD